MRNFLMMLVIVLAFSACNDENAVNDPNLGLVFLTGANSGTTQRVAANSLNFTEGTIRLKEVKFEYETANDSIEYEFDLDQMVLLDYATGETTPDISSINIPAGTYEEVEFEFDLEPLDSEPAIVIEGTFEYNGQSTPVRFEFNYEDTFELSYEGSVTLNADITAVAQIEINANAWFANITDAELAVAELDSEGVMVISKDVNSDLFDIASDGLELATDVKIDF